MVRLVHASDRAMLIVFDERIGPAAGRDVRLLHEWLRDEPIPGVEDLHPGYATLLIRYDPLRCGHEALARAIEDRAVGLTGRPERPGRSFEIPVHYGGPDGPDLALVARAANLSEDEVVAAHSQAAYEVCFIGFLPGFPYLSGLPERLHTSRRDTPRAVVPTGSVAIAGAQAGVYPLRSPGGWNVIGRTDFALFDPRHEGGATLSAGDRVRFLPVTSSL